MSQIIEALGPAFTERKAVAQANYSALVCSIADGETHDQEKCLTIIVAANRSPQQLQDDVARAKERSKVQRLLATEPAYREQLQVAETELAEEKRAFAEYYDARNSRVVALNERIDSIKGQLKCCCDARAGRS